LTSAATLPPPDTGSHAAAAKTRANTKAGVGPAFTSDVLLANLETLGVVGPQPRFPTSSELRFAMNSVATPAPTPRSPRCLRIA
jgi:hypothetical protein